MDPTGHALTAYALVRDEDGRVLILRPPGRRYWHLPGGAALPAEPPREAAARETREETGLAVTPGRLLVADWISPRAPGRRARLALLFSVPPLGEAEAARVTLSAEHDAWRLEPPARALLLLHPRVAARLAAALSHPDRTTYRETRHERTPTP